MNGDLERALSRLRFDDQVLGYSLLTRGGRPFVSFSIPNELFPRVKDSINLYKSELRLMTTDADEGLVVLSPVDDNWILTVLYVKDLQLGLAIAKTKNVLRLLEGIALPPPPEDFEDSAESNLKVLESIALQAASTSQASPDAESDTLVGSLDGTAPETTPFSAVPDRPPESFSVKPETIPKRGTAYQTALSLESNLHNEMRETHRHFGFDVLMLVDGIMSASQIADSMFQSNERVIELLKWAASKWIVDVPEAEEEVPVAESIMGKLVKYPRFEGDLSKVKNGDIEILRLCNGTRTTEEIAELTRIPHPKVVETIARNKKHGIKMIGKTV
ncbi:MAG: hypothetical protein ACE5H4_03730 [Candidatus Thorarchaeota archaeon]